MNASGKPAEKVLVVLYSHPELYPPTMNAVSNLADHYAEVHVLYKPHKKNDWEWPENVHLHPVGEMVTARAFMQSSFRKRMRAHLNFALRFLFLFIKVRPGILLLYDPYPALFYRIIRPFLFRKPFLWYHNHDVIEMTDINTGNRMIGILSASEKSLLKEADLFTLPAFERKAFFDLEGMKGKYVTLPNFPSRKVYSAPPSRQVAETINIGFQGSICAGRGLEGLVGLLPMEIEGRQVRLSITGFCNDDRYRDSLYDAIGDLEEKGIVKLNDAVPYRQLAKVMREITIGWVYYGMDSDMDHSMGTASNKFFECCAMGLPVLYNGRNSFDIYKDFKWAIPVELASETVSDKIRYIVENYRSLSDSAYDQFVKELNYEHAFQEVLKILPGVE